MDVVPIFIREIVSVTIWRTNCVNIFFQIQFNWENNASILSKKQIITLMPIFRNIVLYDLSTFMAHFENFTPNWVERAWYHFDVWNATGGWIYTSIPNKHVLYVYILEISLSWISSPLCFFFSEDIMVLSTLHITKLF